MRKLKGYGYQKDNDELLQLKEITLHCSVSELDSLIEFFKNVRMSHSEFKEIEFTHSHLRDWDKYWKFGDLDIVVSNAVEGKKKL